MIVLLSSRLELVLVKNLINPSEESKALKNVFSSRILNKILISL